MVKKWSIVYYKSRSNKSPVFDFIQSFDIKTRARIIDTLDILKEFGININLPYSKKLTGIDLWEIRILGKNNLRILYVAIANKSFLLLHGFRKKKNRTDRYEIDTALKRLKEYKSGKSGIAI